MSKDHRTSRRTSFQFVSYFILTLVAIIMVFPFIWMITGGFKTTAQLFSFPPVLVPKPWVWRNLVEAWVKVNFFRALINTIIFAGGTTFLAVILNSMAGFALAKFDFFGRDFLFGLVLITLIIPFQIIMIPLFVILRQFGLLDTYTGLILPRVADAFGIFMVKQYLQTVPDELLDAAKIDGASSWRIFWMIIFPLIKPATSVVAIMIFQWRWNDLIWPLIVVTSEKMRPIQLALTIFQGQFQIEWHYMLAMSSLSMFPMLIVFVFFQKYFIQGITMSGLKG